MRKANLPIFNVLKDIRSRIRCDRIVVVSCPTGSGKTLAVGQSLLPDLNGRGRIWHTVPRVLIAKNAATGVEKLFGIRPGIITGPYSANEKEPLVFITEGSFLNRQKQLSNQDILIVDEIHEQGVLNTLVLAVAKQHYQRGGKVILMSATMQAEKFLSYFDAGHLVSLPETERPFINKIVEISSFEAAIDLAAQQNGPVLFGFPGKGEIQDFINRVEGRGIPVFSLHGEQEEWEEAETIKALKAGQFCFVAATSVAMSGITLPNLVAVVPPVYGKQIVNGKLENYILSAAEAKQWEGRVGRLQPGLVINIKGVDRPEYPAPEIERVDTLDLILQVKHIGLSIEDLIDKPVSDSISKAQEILIAAKLLLPDGNLSLKGEEIVKLGQGVEFGLFAIAGDSLGISATARKLAAIHASGSPFRKSNWHYSVVRSHSPEWLFSEHMIVLMACQEEIPFDPNFLKSNGIFWRGVKSLRRKFEEIDLEFQDKIPINPELVKQLFSEALPSLIFERGTNGWERAATNSSGKVFATLAPVQIKRGRLVDMETALY